MATSRSETKTVLRFIHAFVEESRRGMGFNQAVRKRLSRKLQQRGLNVRDLGLPDDWREFDRKLLRPRPRLLAFISAYAMLSGLPYQRIVDQGGMVIFRTFWGLCAIQDDLIDEIPTRAIATLPNEAQKRRRLYNAIFGSDRIFYRAAYTIIIDEIEQRSPLRSDDRWYLKTTLAQWYHFLVAQEAQIVSTEPEAHSFDFCRAYREQQDARITRALVACLNGTNCMAPEYQQLETVMPWLAYRSQMIDDVADTVEDLQAGRPNYAVGALNEFPAERAALERRLGSSSIGKVTPRIFKSIAPCSYQLLEETFALYGQALVEREGFTGNVLDIAGRGAFHAFPVIRDVMYKINPRYANF